MYYCRNEFLLLYFGKIVVQMFCHGQGEESNVYMKCPCCLIMCRFACQRRLRGWSLVAVEFSKLGTIRRSKHSLLRSVKRLKSALCGKEGIGSTNGSGLKADTVASVFVQQFAEYSCPLCTRNDISKRRQNTAWSKRGEHSNKERHHYTGRVVHARGANIAGKFENYYFHLTQTSYRHNTRNKNT